MNEKLDNIKTNAKNVGRIAFKNLPYFLIMFISLLLVGLTEFIKANFDWKVFFSSNYLFNVLLLNGAGFLMATSATLMTADRIIAKDETGEITTATVALSEMAIPLSDQRVDIFLKEINLRRKRRLWIEKQNMKLVKLDKRASLKATIQYGEYVDFERANDDLSINEKLKRFKKGCKNHKVYRYVYKRAIITEHLKDEWLDEHIEYLHVRHKKITRMLLTTGVQYSANDDLPNKSASVLMQGLLPKFILTISITSILLSFSLDLVRLKWISALTIMIKILSCIANFIYGRNFAPQYVRGTTLDSLHKRIRWIKEYNEWKKLNDEKK